MTWELSCFYGNKVSRISVHDYYLFDVIICHWKLKLWTARSYLSLNFFLKFLDCVEVEMEMKETITDREVVQLNSKHPVQANQTNR